MLTCLECNKKFQVLKHTHFKFKCTGTCKSTKDYLEKYPNAILVSDEVKKKIAQSEESYIKKYGEENGKIKWKEYCHKLSIKGTLSGYLAHGKTEEDWKANNKSRAITLENLSKKYGKIEGIKRFTSYCKLQKRAGNTLDWYIEKYGDQEGNIRYLELNKTKGITLKNMTRKYGEIEGRIRYDAWLEATKGNIISNLQKEIIIEIISFIPTNYIFHEGIFGKEFCSYNERPYMYDFVITDPIKICIEINGDFYHANPQKYKFDDVINIRGSDGKIKAGQIWANDKIKKTVLESKGYRVYYIWESDWKKDKFCELEKVKEWLSIKK